MEADRPTADAPPAVLGYRWPAGKLDPGEAPEVTLSEQDLQDLRAVGYLDGEEEDLEAVRPDAGASTADD